MAALFNIYDTLDVLEYICTYVYSKHLLREKWDYVQQLCRYQAISKHSNYIIIYLFTYSFVYCITIYVYWKVICEFKKYIVTS